MIKPRRLSLLVIAAVTGYTATAQVISNDRLKELFRNRQLLGSYQQKSSLSVNANQVSLKELDSALGKNESLFVNNAVIKAGFTPVTLVQQANSKLPYDWNLGSMIPARGYQVMVSAGVYAKIGKHITMQVAPELVSAANKDFEGFSSQLNEKAWADRYIFWNRSDIPEQFGSGAYHKVLPGQSFIRYNAGAISAGISTENLWWGPGYRNSLIMSTNAPGFLHATINTTRPINTGIGSFEGQIIGGKLSSSGILPPRIYSVYNGNFVYEPKHEEDRYIAGMVLTWNPKWTPGLYLGVAKASYLYMSDISNPLDVLPFQGFFGRTRTAAEKNGRKASIGSLFVRYVMPAENAELYMEYGRKDISLMPWNVLQSDPYRRAYVAGFRKLFATRNNAHIQFAAELTQMQAPTAELIRSPDSWYTHTYVRQGYTHMGRSLGAGIGPGSNSQTFEVSWIKGLKRLGMQFERVRYNSDYYYYAFEYLSDFRRHWIDLSTTFKADWDYKSFLFSAQLGIIRSYNYKWLVIQVDPNEYLAPGNEILNVSGRLAVSYRF
ncbi:capsule assembly Wzi family protein [Sediminibacterium ginsengisoli]|uniref:Capsule assembly protein Wzi n=1 Tax=Sediminibacterium ginsengisoli TaxID=413434 RepID=A0A1T4N3Y0_9BACT|nr:capsule assembly Wzi family protein [Sediminibacterium ginsengisoli]SJZ73922.1 Capsule assembly protein Wzi [Sediminibacterium ginsengisoli]